MSTQNETVQQNKNNASSTPASMEQENASSGGYALSPPAFQLKAGNAGNSPNQNNSSSSGGAALMPPPFQLKAGSGNMPEDVRGQMEGTFQTDFSNVNIHQNSQSATDVGALAYTQGNDVHFAPGQFKPDTTAGQELIGHELTHVVQQRAGRVQPTTQAAGMPVNDDKGLEKEADVMGRKAAQMKKSNHHPIQTKTSSSNVIQKKGNEEEKTRKKRVEETITYARSQVAEVSTKIKTYKNQSSPSDDEKAIILGQLAVESARMEFLLGTIYHGGINKSWEKKSNSGKLVDKYISSVGAKEGSSWCTVFVGYVYKTAVDMEMKGDIGNKKNRNLFMSGYRIRSAKEDRGGKFLGLRSGFKSKTSNNPWVNLKTEVNEQKNDEDKKKKINDFFTTNFEPKPGDILILRRSSVKSGNKMKENSFTEGIKYEKWNEEKNKMETKTKSAAQSHTALIESYDKANCILYTIEGNKGGQVTGRSYDLKKKNVLKEIIFIKRLGLGNIKDPAKTKPEETSGSEVPYTEEAQIDGQKDLIEPISQIVSSLSRHAAEKGYTYKEGTKDEDKSWATDSVFKMSGEKSGGKDS